MLPKKMWQLACIHRFAFWRTSRFENSPKPHPLTESEYDTTGKNLDTTIAIRSSWYDDIYHIRTHSFAIVTPLALGVGLVD
jgi:hypothetical protein